ncbi:MAG: hypothetical protein GAS50_02405 [Desulfobacterales bacterium]|jgi:hypothetical protein|nr:hypothetical protein [Desulfobacterales bacterium]
MAQAFVIMQIGNKELDNIFQKAISPAILSSGLSVKRVDKHNEGGLLKSEIITFIQESDIIIADLTNERPNCYLEIGFTMGIDKFKNLILTVREDHFPDNPKYKKGGPKVHFDLAGYDILPWSPDDVDSFKENLENRINRRLLIISPSEKPVESVWDKGWIQKHREKAQMGLSESNLKGLMEIRFSITPPKISKSQRELDEAARSSEIHTFGWPIGVYLYNVPESKPHPTTEGIVAEIKTETYDYWTINRNGDFYSLISLFEDYRKKPENIFFDTRIVRITEALLYCAKLYLFLGVDTNKKVFFSIRHSGLENRTLIAANQSRRLRKDYKSLENEVDTTIEFTLNQIESDLVQLVQKITDPLFTLFDFFQLADSVYEDIVNKFVKGQM